jgi:hypothetical protein
MAKEKRLLARVKPGTGVRGTGTVTGLYWIQFRLDLAKYDIVLGSIGVRGNEEGYCDVKADQYFFEPRKIEMR